MAASFFGKVGEVLLFLFKTSVDGFWSELPDLCTLTYLLRTRAGVFCTHHTCVKLPINMYEQLSSEARCLDFSLCLYLHHSLCVRAMKALAMLCTNTGASENGLFIQIIYKYRKPHELAHFFTKQQFSSTAFAQSWCCYSDFHTRYMTVLVGIH